ncbi:MAG: hypothetical protein J6I84_04700 [Bacilli bacterium]|nr:hypothetical protein [Bacilli bacterium]
MNNLDFIDHSPKFDPLASEREIDNASLEKQYASLSEEEKNLVYAKLNGYRYIPPTIRQMWEDTYFLGGEAFYNKGIALFDYWKKVLEDDIFSGPFFIKKNYIVASGAIGIGKSTFARLCWMENHARMLSMRQPYSTLKIVPKTLSYVIMHKSEETAIVEFKRWFLRDVMELSPFFKNVKNENFKFKVICSGPRGVAGLGSDRNVVYIGNSIDY